MFLIEKETNPTTSPIRGKGSSGHVGPVPSPVPKEPCCVLPLTIGNNLKIEEEETKLLLVQISLMLNTLIVVGWIKDEGSWKKRNQKQALLWIENKPELWLRKRRKRQKLQKFFDWSINKKYLRILLKSEKNTRWSIYNILLFRGKKG